MKTTRNRALVFGIFACLLLLGAGCAADQEIAERNRRNSTTIANAAGELFAQIFEGDELRRSVSGFHRENDRWPTNFVEIATYAQSSNHTFNLTRYRDVVLIPQADGGLQLRYLVERNSTLQPPKKGDFATNNAASRSLEELFKPKPQK